MWGIEDVSNTGRQKYDIRSCTLTSAGSESLIGQCVLSGAERKQYLVTYRIRIGY